jgi:hypothetical protein
MESATFSTSAIRIPRGELGKTGVQMEGVGVEFHSPTPCLIFDFASFEFSLHLEHQLCYYLYIFVLLLPEIL